MQGRDCLISDILKYIFILKQWYSSERQDHELLNCEAMANLKHELDTRFEPFIQNEFLMLATFLDPNSKLKYWYNTRSEPHFSLEYIKNKLLVEYEALKKLEDNTDEVTTDGQNEEMIADNVGHQEDALLVGGATPNRDEEFYGFPNISVNDYGSQQFPQITIPMENNEHTRTNKELVNREVSEYMSQATTQEIHPILYWGKYKDRYPYLSTVARKFIGGPPSSADSERLFSIGARIVTPARNRLLPETIGKLMRTQHNLMSFKNIFLHRDPPAPAK